MSQRCVVCGQPLPAGVSEVEMHRRLEELNATAAEQAATTLKRELDRQREVNGGRGILGTRAARADEQVSHSRAIQSLGQFCGARRIIRLLPHRPIQ
jgi:hypothetical protein